MRRIHSFCPTYPLLLNPSHFICEGYLTHLTFTLALPCPAVLPVMPGGI